MINLNNLGMIMWQRIFWSTPYDTGNLARNGIGGLGTMGADAVGFTLFDHGFGSVGKGTEYGRILNEVPVIHCKRVNSRTGRASAWSYVNKHYQWVDKFAEIWANEMPLYAPIRRI